MPRSVVVSCDCTVIEPLSNPVLCVEKKKCAREWIFRSHLGSWTIGHFRVATVVVPFPQFSHVHLCCQGSIKSEPSGRLSRRSATASHPNQPQNYHKGNGDAAQRMMAGVRLKELLVWATWAKKIPSIPVGVTSCSACYPLVVLNRM